MVLTKQCLKGKSQKGGKDETDLFGAFVSLDPRNNLNALSNDKGCPGQGHNKIPDISCTHHKVSPSHKVQAEHCTNSTK